MTVRALLDSTTVVGYLQSRSVIPVGVTGTARPLRGGLSSEVLEVLWPDGAAVVKQSLPRLRVAAAWDAPPERILTEARALKLVSRLTPEHVPQVLDVDEASLTLTMSLAPPEAANWKDRLLDGEIHAKTAAVLGSLLRTWHDRTADQDLVRKAFHDLAVFRQLRLEPFHEQVARGFPDLERPITAVVDELTSNRRCLVHGDFSPKNVLAGGATVWVLDWEVAHFGNPVFDVAFMSAHLLLKACRAPLRAASIEGAWRAFIAAYLKTDLPSNDFDGRTLARHTACLLLARVDGKSPVEYLGPLEREAVRQLGRRLLLDSDALLDGVWKGSDG